MRAKKKTPARRPPASLARLCERTAACKRAGADLEQAACRLVDALNVGEPNAFRYAQNDLKSFALLYAAAFRAVMGSLEGFETKGGTTP